jgi:hypothetical protein
MQIRYKNSALTSQKTQLVSMTMINWLMLLKEISVYSENHMKHIDTLCEQNSELLIVKTGGTCKVTTVL